ncbi:MAG: tripartite tricarboxylate transporter substrate binding protein [Betaproteobacteria bacterium]|nr:tripartite tricarboxylate transporter substrate binding protein [Betaproteobacteria bacterium]
MKDAINTQNLVLAMAIAAASTAALAQGYPDKPIRVIIPYPPGGTTDLVVRLVQNRLQSQLGQSLLIENRAGATGAIGAEAVARAAPDGYTLMYTPGTDMTLRQFLMKANLVDAIKDFSPISATVLSSSVIAAHPSMPFTNAKEFLDYARQNPGKLNYGSPGLGSNFHLAGEFLKMHGVVLTHVPYKGGGPALAAVIAGETNLALNDFTTMLPMMREGRARPIALIDAKRHPVLPEIPAMGELLPGYSMPASWFAFFGPANMSQPVVMRLNSEIAKAFIAPDVKPRIDERSLINITGKPEEITGYLRTGLEVYGKIVKAAGIKPE